MSKPAPPIHMQWMGDSFVPAGKYWAKKADEIFVVGEVYPIEVREDRSQKSQAHYFSSVKSAWDNLPEEVADRFPTPEHLRKWALIRAGYRDERSLVCSSKAEALRLASFLRPMDDFAVVVVREAVVMVFTAKSQSYRSMNREEFQKSKVAVLDILAQAIGTTTKQLTHAGEQA